MSAAPPDIPALPAGLCYVDDRQPGIRRRRQGKRFVYFDANGQRIGDAEEIRRLDKLAIPPAYREVWICPDPNGHLQATGRDARGRKQYRYHPRWREVRDADKYERLLRFGQALPRLRRHIDAQLRLPGLGRDKVVALAVALLDATLIRVGNHRYARDNRSYGLTTLRTRHVDVNGSRIRFRFKGKSGIEHDVSLEHPRLARVLRRCLELPGQDLLQYRTRTASRTASAPTTSTSTCAGTPARISAPRTTAPGPAARWRWSACGVPKPTGSARWWRRSPPNWATAWRSAGNATSTRRSSRPTRPGNWASSGAPASAAG